MDDFASNVASEYPYLSDSSSPICYFNSAAKSILPRSAEKRGADALSERSTPWAKDSSSEHLERARELFSQLVNAPSADYVAACPSTAFAMSMAAANVLKMGLLKPGKNVILLEKEMGSVVYPWQNACESSGATLRIARTPSDTDRSRTAQTWADMVLEAADENTVVLALPW
jgi:cysteine desulfurase/selenocysteine lyase